VRCAQGHKFISWMVVGDLTARNFGLLIAYVLPGFVVLWGLSCVSPTVSTWLSGAGASGPSFGGFLYVFLTSVGCGMTASVIRWAALDKLHHHTGINPPNLNFATYPKHLEAYERINEHHYQYYQFYGNTFFALLTAYPLWRISGSDGGLVSDFAFVFVEVMFFAGSRNTLRLFYHRATQLLGESEISHDERNRRQAPSKIEDLPQESDDTD